MTEHLLIYKVNAKINRSRKKLLFVVIDGHSEDTSLLVALVSNFAFKGNSRIALSDELWLYPSVQGTILSGYLGENFESDLTPTNGMMRSLVSWPWLSATNRQSLADEWSVDYAPGDGLTMPPKHYEKKVNELFEISQKSVFALLSGSFTSFEDYEEFFNQPEHLLSAKANLSLAIGMDPILGHRVRSLRARTSREGYSAASSLLVRQLVSAKTRLNRESKAIAHPDKRVAAYLSGMNSLGVKVAVVKSTSFLTQSFSHGRGESKLELFFTR